MAVIETWLRQDLKGLVTVRSLQGQVFSLDNGGNLIGVKVTKDGQPVTLTGTVTGYCILSDGQTVTVTGSGKSGIQNENEAYIVLPQLVYSVPGQISIVIKLTSGSVTTTLAACTGYVYRSRTSNEVVPPGTPIPDLATMEEVIRRATAATVGAEKVDASMTKEGDVITISVTDRDGNVTEKTVTDTADDVAELNSALLLLDDIPDTVQTLMRGADGKVSGIVHTSTAAGGGVVRTDTFAFTDAAVTETRTLDSGETLTIVVNRTTKAVTITHTAA